MKNARRLAVGIAFAGVVAGSVPALATSAAAGAGTVPHTLAAAAAARPGSIIGDGKHAPAVVVLTAAASPHRRAGGEICTATTGDVCWHANGSGNQLGANDLGVGTNFVVVNYSGASGQGEFQTGTGKCLYASGDKLMEGSNPCASNSLTETFSFGINSGCGCGHIYTSILELNANILVTGTTATHVWVRPETSGDLRTWSGP